MSNELADSAAKLLDLSIAALFKVPESVWAAIIAAVFTWVGVVLSNRNSRKQLTQQLEFGRREAQSQRIAEVRRDMYLSFAAEMTRLNQLVASIAVDGPPMREHNSSFQSFVSAGNQTLLVAGIETAMVVAKILSHGGTKYMEFAGPYQQVLAHRKMIDTYTKLSEMSLEEQRRINSEMTQYNESVQKNPERFQALSRSHASQAIMTKELQEKSNQEYQKAVSLVLSYSSEFLKGSANEGLKMHSDFIAAARADLGLTDGLDELHKRMSEDAAKMKSRVEGLIAALKQ